MAFLFRRAQQPATVPPPPPPLPPPIDSASPPVSDHLIQPALSAYISGNKVLSNAESGIVQKGTLMTVARSIRHCVSGMSPWDISDLTLGLYKIATRHSLEGVSDTIEGSIVSNKQELEEILYWLDWSWASYLADEKGIVEFLKIEPQQVKKHVNTSAILKPAYCIAIDDVKKCVVLSIRGTYAATDVLTDLQPHSERFEGGYAHSGILSAARWILDNENDNLQLLLSENSGYKMILTGHSLGAGAACLLAYLLRESVGSRNKRISSRLGISSSMIECWGFGCPPCVDKELCEGAPFIKNIVLQDDIVARASIAALEDLRSEILQTDWADVLEDGGTAKKMLGLVNSTNSVLGNVERALGYENGTFYQQAKSRSYAALVESFRASVIGARPGLFGNNGAQGHHFPPGQYGPPPAQYGQYGPPVHFEQSGYYGPPGQHGHGPSGYYTATSQYYPGGPPPPNAMQGPRPHNFVGWISYGASAIGSLLNSPGVTSQIQGNTDQIQGNTSLSESTRHFMEGGRLFVPGVLYHVKRILPEGSCSSAAARNGLLASTTEGSSSSAATRNGLLTSSTEMTSSTSSDNLDTTLARRADEESDGSAAKALNSVRYTVIKGSNPQSRFMKIVLSKSLLSDHSLVAYKDGMTDAINASQEM